MVLKNLVMTDFNDNHPEKRDDEKFLTNTTLSGFYRIKLETKRIGFIPYDNTGVKLKDRDCFPIFASIQEIEDLMAQQEIFDINQLNIFLVSKSK